MDEVTAHVSMFEAKVNDGYYELGLATAQLVREAVMIGRGTIGEEEKKEALTVDESENPWAQSEDKGQGPGEAEESLIDL